MSSIIKSGSAPSNTADGKYFLQTDQACYAELKRGRTYIMTAQEEAKVSHYVIITNADFTVTFNGDSDLVQVGIANNAIVMNVHRACRIDFTQGGNLEFKEGTAEFSSRIEMGVNASGNVLVASSLPQQGDFAGQICSLTTGATYVWTGSQWSSTAGSSTLPTPTTTNKGGILANYNGVWTNFPNIFFGRFNASNVSTEPLVANAWRYYNIAVCTRASGPFHHAFTLQFGNHTSQSQKITVDLVGSADANMAVTTLKSACTLFPSKSVTSTTQSLGPNMLKFGYEGKNIWMAVWATQPYAIAGTFMNAIYTGTTAEYRGITLTGTQSEPTGFAWVASGNTFFNTSVPVSTAANQMLVSDGNGGWKSVTSAQAGDNLNGCNWRFLPSQNIEQSQYGFVTIGIMSPSAGSTEDPFHYAFSIQNGAHALSSHRYFFDVVGKCKVENNVASVTQIRVTCTRMPSWTVYDKTDSQEWTFNGIAYKVVGSKIKLALCWGSQWGAVGKPTFTIRDIIADSTFSSQPKTDGFVDEQVVENFSETTYTIVAHDTFLPVPAPTTADNGKVLKVVDGVPTWTSA